MLKRMRRICRVVRDRKSTRLNSSHTVIYTLSLHDALPISGLLSLPPTLGWGLLHRRKTSFGHAQAHAPHLPCRPRSEEHTSELQSHSDLHSFPTRCSSDLRTAESSTDSRLGTVAQTKDVVRACSSACAASAVSS